MGRLYRRPSPRGAPQGSGISRGWDPSRSRASSAPRLSSTKPTQSRTHGGRGGKDRAALPRPASSQRFSVASLTTQRRYTSHQRRLVSPLQRLTQPTPSCPDRSRTTGREATSPLRQARLAGHQPADSVHLAPSTPYSPTNPRHPVLRNLPASHAAGVWILEESYYTPPETDAVTSKPLLLYFEPQGDTAVLHSFKWPATIEPEATAPPLWVRRVGQERR